MSIEVILKEHVEHLGRRGDIVKVADGYARNYLLPRKLALAVTGYSPLQHLFWYDRPSVVGDDPELGVAGTCYRFCDIQAPSCEFCFEVNTGSVGRCFL